MSSMSSAEISLTDKTCREFLTELASNAPTPGGGGAAALGGALGMALSNMVGNLTLGKKKYAAVQDEIGELLDSGAGIMEKLKKLIDEDRDVFLTLMQAFALPKGTPEEAEIRDRKIEERAKAAALVPLEVMRQTLAGIKIQHRMAQIGSIVAVSDAGCGAAFLQAALTSGALNVMANLKIIKDEEFLRNTADEINRLREEGQNIAEETIKISMDKLKKEGGA